MKCVIPLSRFVNKQTNEKIKKFQSSRKLSVNDDVIIFDHMISEKLCLCKHHVKRI